MRTENSIKNISISLISQIIIILLGFISRKIFIDSLGAEYLGVNGLLTNVLSMLSLVESGVGVSIIYNLYKPLAENDTPAVIALVQLYKKIYYVLAIIMLGMGLCLYPLLNILIKEQDNIPFVGVVYSIFLLRNVVSYLNAHKWSLINADQKGYILARYSLFFNVITTIVKAMIILVTGSYVLYLLIDLIIFVFQTILVGRVVNNLYPYIKTKKHYLISTNVKENIIKNFKSVILHNIGTFCVFGTDNLLISALVNNRTVGIYSNYTMVISQMNVLLNQLCGGVGASIGNLIATENNSKNYSIYKILYLINFCIYSTSTIFLYNLINPFIELWVGPDLLISKGVLIIVLLNFYITGMRNPINVFKEKAGIFAPDRYLPLIEAAINLITSFVLAHYLGLVGIFLGTTISTLLVPFWTQPKLVYNLVLKRDFSEYFKDYIYFSLLTLGIGVIVTYLCSLIIFKGWMALIIKGLIVVITCIFSYTCIFYKSNEFKALFNILSPKYTSLKSRLKSVIKYN